MTLSPGVQPCGVATFSLSVSWSESMQRRISLNWRPVLAGYWSDRRTVFLSSMTKTVRTVKGRPFSSRLVRSCSSSWFLEWEVSQSRAAEFCRKERRFVTHHVVEVGDLALRVGNDGEPDLVAAKLFDVGDPLVVAAELVARKTWRGRDHVSNHEVIQHFQLLARMHARTRFGR